MSTPHRLIAAAAIVGALAIAGPVAGAGAATSSTAATPATTASIPCYPFPAWCGSNGHVSPLAPWWVAPALGLPPAQNWPLPFPTGVLPYRTVGPVN